MFQSKKQIPLPRAALSRVSMKSARFMLVLLAALCTHAQEPSKTQRPGQKEDTVVVTTNLVQLDAVVTDKSGRPVSDLQPEDFELIENGHVRPITSFSYISLLKETASSNQGNAHSALKSGPPKLNALRRENVRRAVAIVVDDFGLSFESIARLRSALEKFIEEQTLQSDLIGVIRASSGPGAMLQFTSNRAQILATIKRLKWYPIGRGRMSAFDSMSPIDNDENGVELTGYSASSPPDLSSKEFSGGSLGSLALVIQGLSRFPGRKSIVLISENLPLTTRAAQINGATRVLDRLIQHANQHSIVISTIDARGLPKPGLTADDSQNNLAANQIDKRLLARGIKHAVDQDTLSYLATQTGGKFIHDNNDLTNALNQIMESEEGYYLLAYRPEDMESDGKQKKPHKVNLRLKRPELELRTRSAFYVPVLSRQLADDADGKASLLREALVSPFVREDVHLKITSLFTGRAEITTLVHVNVRDLEFVGSADGTYTGSFDIAMVAFDDNGKVVRQVARTQTLRVPSASYKNLLEHGLVYTLNALITPGAYQVRVAFRDNGSGRLGSDSQFVEVPDARKMDLKVCGFAVQGVEPTPALQTATQGSKTAATESDSHSLRSGPAVRAFAAGEVLTYSYLVYGARGNGAAARPNLISQIRLFRGDKEVFTGNVNPVNRFQRLSDGGIVAEGTLKLGTVLGAGQYFLQVIVTDQLAPVNKQLADQWIDLEIVK